MVELRAKSVERGRLEPPAGGGMVSRQNSSVGTRRKRGRRSRSAPRLQDASKPKKQNKYLDTASSSISSLPGRIQLTMLNSGLIPIGTWVVRPAGGNKSVVSRGVADGGGAGVS